MKALPCQFCHGDAYSRFGPTEVKLLVGRISHFPYKYKCSRCKRLNVLGAVDYNRLPEVPQEESAQE